MDIELFLKAMCISTILGILIIMAIQDMYNVSEYLVESMFKEKSKKLEDDSNVKIEWYRGEKG